MVLDRVVGTTGQELGDLSPLISESGVSVEDEAVFFRGPGVLLNSWVQVVVPPLAALLPDPALRTAATVSTSLGSFPT